MFDYFRGYVPTKNKKCQKKFANGEQLATLREVQKLEEYAGIIAEGVMMVDIDDYEQSELLYTIVKEQDIACRVYKTTRGKHFFFKNSGVEKNGNGLTLAVGISADIKIGKNAYSVLKFNGVEREIIRDCDEPTELPRWLFPVRKGTQMDFLDMGEGSGRNQGLFNYILTLMSSGFSKRQARKCINLINQYILASPLPDDELEVILRDGAFPKEMFFQDKTFLHDVFANTLKNNCHIVKIDSQLHFYHGGVYIAGKQLIEHEMLKMYPRIKRNQRTEVYDYLNIMIQETTDYATANLIAFRNGIYNIKTDELLPFSPDYIITNQIPWDYNPNAYDKGVDEVLGNIACHDPQIRALLEEMAGYSFYRRNQIGKAFVLVGENNNGKSTLLDMITAMLDKKNVSGLDLADLNHNFRASEIVGKLANIGDDISGEYIPDTGNFKKIVTGSPVTVERKNQDPITYVSEVKLLFSANNVPRLGKGKDAAAIKRRLLIIPLLAYFDPKDPSYKPYIIDELTAQPAMEYLVQLGIAGLKRVLKNKGFTESDKVNKSIDEYEEMTNPILGFFKQVEEGEVKVENEPTALVYKHYTLYCNSNSLGAVSNVEFSRQLVKKFNLETKPKKIDGKSTRVFVKVTDV